MISVDESKLNDMQIASIERLSRMMKVAHYADIIVRINGKDERLQGDWLKWYARRYALAAAVGVAPEDIEVKRP